MSSTTRTLHAFMLIVPFAAGAQTWYALPDFPGTGRDDGIALTLDINTILVGTGLEVGWNLTSDFWSYDILTQTWTPAMDLPSTPRQYTAGFAIDGIGYVVGGLDGSGPVVDVWAYDRSLDTWTPVAPLPAFARYAAIGWSHGGRGFIAGGLDANGTPTNECWSYDPTTDQWTQLTAVPGPPRHRTHAMDLLDAALICGGADSAYNALGDCWLWNYTSQQWTIAASLPVAVFNGAAIGSYDLAYLIGGDVGGDNFRNDVWRYLPATDQWITLTVGPPLNPRRGAVIGFSDGWLGGAFYGTGLDNSFVREQDWWHLELPIGLHERETGSLLAFPNPIDDLVQIRGADHCNEGTITVSDLAGSTVFRGPLTTTPIDASVWSPGCYTAIITDPVEGTRVLRLMKR
ncbi:MAG: hypothetical protein KDB88_12605 [Flavobacteriales bacterium]|nr:hypothetical protein [Flavobacteriales bacterium]